MKRLTSWLFFCFFILAFSLSAVSQVSFTASVNKNKVAVGEQFQVTFKINDSGKNFTPPNLSHFRVLSGPNQSSSMQWVNGAMSSSKSYSYYLRAEKPGGYSIGAAEIQVSGKKYTTKPIDITVVKGQTNSNSGNRNQATQQKQQASNNLNSRVFVKCVVSKSEVTVGEQLIATYKLYYNANVGNLNLTELPPFNGFWSETIETKQQQNNVEAVNGTQYHVAEIHKVVLLPQRSGNLEVSSLALDLVVEVKDNARPRSVFDQFFGRSKNVQHTTKSQPIKIKVNPLPSKGKPADFNGAVGQLNFKASLDRNNVKSNDAINLKVVVSGKGNLDLIGEPTIEFPHDFEVYDAKISNKTSVTAGGIKGSKEFEYLMIPRHGGEYEIPPISFTYYDNAKKKYVTKKSEAFAIVVERGENEPAVVSNGSTSSKKDVKIVGSDIRFVHSNSDTLIEKDNFFFASALHFVLLLLPLALFGGFVLFRNQLKNYNNDIVKVKGRRANKLAAKRLSAAKEVMNSDSKQFYEEVFKALYGYLGDKLNIEVAQLSKQVIAETLTNKQVDATVVAKLSEILSACEMARFAPTTGADPSTVYTDAEQIISQIEETLKG